MHRAARWAALLVLVTPAAALGGRSTPARADRPAPWILHAERYPGGLSQGVRAYAALASARRPAPPGPAASGGGAAAGGNVRANARSPLPQNETAVAFDPGHPLRAVAAANDYSTNGLWVGHTSDGGRTWRGFYRGPRLSTTGRRCSGSDPSVVFSRRDHAFYVATLCFTGGAESEIDVWKSADDGATWSRANDAAVVVTNVAPSGAVNGEVFYDKDLLAVDNTRSSSHYGRLYATYIRFHLRANGSSDTCPVQVAYTDRVPTGHPSTSRWTHRSVVAGDRGANGTGASANQWATPVVDPQGGLDVAYVSEDCNSGIDTGLFFKRSANGGRSFGPRVRIDKPGQFVDNPNPDDTLPGKNASIGISPSLAVDPATGTLEYVFQNNVNAGTSGADISFTQSADHGATWSDARTLSVDANGDPAPQDQFFPWISADRDGTVQAVWLDNRDDPSDVLLRTFQATSTDGGATWTFADISTASWDPNRSFFGSGGFIGDYIQVAASRTAVYVLWPDGRHTPGPPDGDTDIYAAPETP